MKTVFVAQVQKEAHCENCGTPFYDGEQAYCQYQEDGSLIWFCNDHYQPANKNRLAAISSLIIADLKYRWACYTGKDKLIKDQHARDWMKAFDNWIEAKQLPKTVLALHLDLSYRYMANPTPLPLGAIMKDRLSQRIYHNSRVKITLTAIKKYSLPGNKGIVTDASYNPTQLVTVDISGHKYDLHAKSLLVIKEAI